MRTFMLLCLAIPVSACVTDDADQADDTEPSVSTTESALCGPYNSPPSSDYRYTFRIGSGATHILPISNYGTTTCANYVVKLDDADSVWNPGNLHVYMPTSTLPTSALACVATSLTVRTYRALGNGMSVGTTTNNAEWTASGCVMETQIVRAEDSPTVEISAQRASYCPSGSTYCATAAYGLPVRLKIEDYE